MAPQITIRTAPGTWVIRTTDGVIAESRSALELSEGAHAPVIYFPRADIAMAFLEGSATVTTCPFKGEASYFSIVGQASTIKDAAWSYTAPQEGVAAIKDHIAFYGSKVAIEQV